MRSTLDSFFNCHNPKGIKLVTKLHICNLKYSIPKEVSVAFHDGSNCNYHFITKELAKEFDGEVSCLGENIEKIQNLLSSNNKRS